MEKTIKPVPGLAGFIVILLTLGSSVYFFLQIRETEEKGMVAAAAILLLIISLFLMKGLLIVQPNHSRILNLFGKYAGTVKDNGWFFVNPFYTTENLSLRAQNLESAKLKVNDKMGNPIEIGAVIVWQVGDTYKAAYDVVNYKEYVIRQSEAAVRHLANSFPYDNLEDEHADITLRNGADKVNDILEEELNERLFPSGINIREARISHLAFAQE